MKTTKKKSTMDILKKSSSIDDKIFDIIIGTALTGFLVFVTYPLIYILSASISAPDVVNSGEMWLFPKDVTFEGFKAVFQNEKIWIGYANSTIYTIVGTGISIVLTMLTAYALSRPNFPGKTLITFFFTFTMFFNGGLIPTYLLIESLGMYNTIWAIVIPGALGMWNIVISRTYIQTSIPEDILEAANIDGCSQGRIFVNIVLPLSIPIIIVIGLFQGVAIWNSWFSGMIYLGDSAKYPLQLILREILILNQTADTSNVLDATTLAEQMEVANLIKYAVMIVASLPTIIIYPFLQKHFEKGMTVGAIKG